jgi:hypothetical protein
MSGVGGVLAVVVPTALGSSVASTLITRYATQSRERRAAQAEVRRTMRAAQRKALLTNLTPELPSCRRHWMSSYDDITRAALVRTHFEHDYLK